MREAGVVEVFDGAVRLISDRGLEPGSFDVVDALRLAAGGGERCTAVLWACVSLLDAEVGDPLRWSDASSESEVVGTLRRLASAASGYRDT